jgi:hypothetical protein
MRKLFALALALLTTTAVHAAPAVVQSVSGHGQNVTGAMTLPGAPTAGNLILACMGSNPQLYTSMDQSKWSLIKQGGSGNSSAFMAYRYVKAGDTATLPPMLTAGPGASFMSYEAVEISGVLGSTQSDLEQTDSKFGQTGSGTVALNTLTTTHVNDLAVSCGFNYNGTSNISMSAGWTTVQQSFNNADYGSWADTWQTFASSGASVTGTWTVSTTTNPFGYITALLCGGSCPAANQQQASKINSYDVLQNGVAARANVSKVNTYVVLTYSTSVSKINSYVVLTNAPPKGFLLHNFP